MRQTVKGEISIQGEGFVKGLAIDAVIFGFHEDQVKILLIKHGGTDLFALPGGYIFEKEGLTNAAKRIVLQ
jgi:8-oxo-dGTP diphosphatase